MVDLTLISGSFYFSFVFIENEGFGASQSGDSVTSIPAGGFFLFMSLLRKHMIFCDFSMICRQNDRNLSSTRGTINKTGILDSIKFRWVP